MSIRYNSNNNVETIISGITPAGDLEAGAVATCTGTFTIPALTTGHITSISVTFPSGFQMPDNDYHVMFDYVANAAWNFGITARTKTGFTLNIRNVAESATLETTDIPYFAFKTYSVQYAAQNHEDLTNIKSVVPTTASSTNKLVTANQLSTLETSVDGRLDNLEDVVPSGATISNQLITNSELTTALATKQNALIFDNTPTLGSNNPVTSDGVKNAIDAIPSGAIALGIIDKNGSKNLLPNRGAGTTATVYGVKFTIQDDGSVKANGTATGGQAIFQVCYKVPLKQGESYIISGGLSGSKFTYANAINNNTYVKTIGLSVGDHSSQYDQNPFTPDYDGYTHIEIGVAINEGITCNNDVFYPMVRLAEDPIEIYQPYAMTNQDMSNVKLINYTANTDYLSNIQYTTVRKLGAIVILSFNSSFSADLPNGTTSLLSGLPKPIGQTHCNIVSGDGSNIRTYVHVNGEFYADSVAGGSITTNNKWFAGQVVYFTNE